MALGKKWLQKELLVLGNEPFLAMALNGKSVKHLIADFGLAALRLCECELRSPLLIPYPSQSAKSFLVHKKEKDYVQNWVWNNMPEVVHIVKQNLPVI